MKLRHHMLATLSCLSAEFLEFHLTNKTIFDAIFFRKTTMYSRETINLFVIFVDGTPPPTLKQVAFTLETLSRKKCQSN